VALEEWGCQGDAKLNFKDAVVCAAGFVKWLVEDGPLGEDRNDVLDFDGNNNK